MALGLEHLRQSSESFVPELLPLERVVPRHNPPESRAPTMGFFSFDDYFLSFRGRTGRCSWPTYSDKGRMIRLFARCSMM